MLCVLSDCGPLSCHAGGKWVRMRETGTIIHLRVFVRREDPDQRRSMSQLIGDLEQLVQEDQQALSVTYEMYDELNQYIEGICHGSV